ncbi:hypothetical protein KPH14_013096, partial [Odynerus spinipes]
MPPFNGKEEYVKSSEEQYIVIDAEDLENLVEERLDISDHMRVISEILRQFHEMRSTRAERDKVMFETRDQMREAMERLNELIMEFIRNSEEENRRNEAERKRAQEERERAQEER